MSSYSVVVPVYKSKATLSHLIERLHPVLEGLGGTYELVLVNDGSGDGTWDEVARLRDLHPWVRGLNLMRNYGQHNALLAGIRAARHEITITIDDDLQHPPEVIPDLIKMLDEQSLEVVYGTAQRRSYGFVRNAATLLARAALGTAMGRDMARQVSAFRVFRTDLRVAFANYRSPNLSIDVLLSWGTTRVGSLVVRHDPRHAGTSNYSFLSLFKHTIDLLTNFSTWPLRAATLTGFIFMFFGVGVLAYVIAVYFLVEGKEPGFPFLASTIAIFAGAQLFAIGIVGEYLARIFLRTMDRPTYVMWPEVQAVEGSQAEVSEAEAPKPEEASESEAPEGV